MGTVLRTTTLGIVFAWLAVPAAGCHAPDPEREDTRAAVEADVEADAETDATKAGAQPAGPPLVVDVEDEEAVGPFASWTNVKTFGATGDGTTDDTAALQAAIKSLCAPTTDSSPLATIRAPTSFAPSSPLR